MMGAARPRRARWRTAKSRRKLQRVAKHSGGTKATDFDESFHGEPPDRLVLSALRFWEVERDLIEERLAAKRSARVAC